MKRRLAVLALLTFTAGLAVVAAAVGGARQAPVTGTIAVLGPYSDADQGSFEAVLAGFRQRNPDVTVDYTSAGADAGATLARLVALGVGVPDVAVLTLPADATVLRNLAGRGALSPIGFAARALDANYAFAWKRIGSVGGSLYGVPFKATERSAFWYDARLFRAAGVQAPKTWQELERVAGRLLRAGVKPFAIPAADGRALGDIFESVYLGQHGQTRYERLARHEIKWTDPSVEAALRAMRSVILNPFLVSGGTQAALETDFRTAVMQVVGMRPKAAMVFGGSAVLPVLRSAKGVRPMNQLGTFAFPTIGEPPARVIGRADAIVMVKDSAAARALIQYLATPEAASIWAKRGGFLSPNRKVEPSAYPLASSRTLAAALTRASAFRLDLSERQPATLQARLGELLQEYVRHPSRLDRITALLEAAATGPSRRV